VRDLTTTLVFNRVQTENTDGDLRSGFYSGCVPFTTVGKRCQKHEGTKKRVSNSVKIYQQRYLKFVKHQLHRYTGWPKKK